MSRRPRLRAPPVLSGLADWAVRYGWVAITLIVAGDGVFPLLPGETAIIVGAVAAADGRLSLAVVISAGVVGAVAGDSTAYLVGRWGGLGIRRRLARLAGEERIVAAERMVQRRGPALVFVGRFLPGIRIAINLSCGAGHLSYRRFLIFDALGAAAWATQAALLGYFLGRAFERRPWIGLLIALGVAAVVGGVIALQERRRVRREAAQAGDAA